VREINEIKKIIQDVKKEFHKDLKSLKKIKCKPWEQTVP
jgi:hypothetical protein